MTEYPYGYCGMPCALCTRYRTEGKSRCIGCTHGGYYSEPCKVHHCCRDKNISICGACVDFPCERLGRMGDFSDLHTNRVKERTGKTVAENGFDKWYSDYAERAKLLTVALREYNDGRMKRYLCELFIQNDYETVAEIMRRAQAIGGTQKEKAKAFRALVSEFFVENC